MKRYLRIAALCALWLIPMAAQAAGVDTDGVVRNRFGLGTESYPYVYNGTSWDRQRTPTVFKTLSAVVITSETTVWTPTSGKKFRLMGFCLTQGVATGAVTFKDNTGGTVIFTLPANTIGVSQCTPPLYNGIRARRPTTS